MSADSVPGVCAESAADRAADRAGRGADSTAREWCGGVGVFMILCKSFPRECLTGLISVFQNTLDW